MDDPYFQPPPPPPPPPINSNYQQYIQQQDTSTEQGYNQGTQPFNSFDQNQDDYSQYQEPFNNQQQYLTYNRQAPDSHKSYIDQQPFYYDGQAEQQQADEQYTYEDFPDNQQPKYYIQQVGDNNEVIQLKDQSQQVEDPYQAQNYIGYQNNQQETHAFDQEYQQQQDVQSQDAQRWLDYNTNVNSQQIEPLQQIQNVQEQSSTIYSQPDIYQQQFQPQQYSYSLASQASQIQPEQYQELRPQVQLYLNTQTGQYQPAPPPTPPPGSQVVETDQQQTQTQTYQQPIIQAAVPQASLPQVIYQQAQQTWSAPLEFKDYSNKELENLTNLGEKQSKAKVPDWLKEEMRRRGLLGSLDKETKARKDDGSDSDNEAKNEPSKELLKSKIKGRSIWEDEEDLKEEQYKRDQAANQVTKKHLTQLLLGVTDALIESIAKQVYDSVPRKTSLEATKRSIALQDDSKQNDNTNATAQQAVRSNDSNNSNNSQSSQSQSGGPNILGLTYGSVESDDENRSQSSKQQQGNKANIGENEEQQQELLSKEQVQLNNVEAKVKVGTNSVLSDQGEESMELAPLNSTAKIKNNNKNHLGEEPQENIKLQSYSNSDIESEKEESEVSQEDIGQGYIQQQQQNVNLNQQQAQKFFKGQSVWYVDERGRLPAKILQSGILNSKEEVLCKIVVQGQIQEVLCQLLQPRGGTGEQIKQEQISQPKINDESSSFVTNKQDDKQTLCQVDNQLIPEVVQETHNGSIDESKLFIKQQTISSPEIVNKSQNQNQGSRDENLPLNKEQKEKNGSSKQNRESKQKQTRRREQNDSDNSQQVQNQPKRSRHSPIKYQSSRQHKSSQQETHRKYRKTVSDSSDTEVVNKTTPRVRGRGKAHIDTKVKVPSKDRKRYRSRSKSDSYRSKRHYKHRSQQQDRTQSRERSISKGHYRKSPNQQRERARRSRSSSRDRKRIEHEPYKHEKTKSKHKKQ